MHSGIGYRLRLVMGYYKEKKNGCVCLAFEEGKVVGIRDA